MAEQFARKPRGVLNLKAGAQKFHLSLHPPTADLAFFVEHYWIIGWDLRGQEPYCPETLPHPCVHLVIEEGDSRIQGVTVGKFSTLLEGMGRVFGVKFRPGAFYPFVRSPVSQFTNGTIGLGAVFGAVGDALAEAMIACTDELAMVALAEDFLRERLPERDEHVATINRIVNRIIADRAITKVDDIVERLGVNKRTLQRIFREYVGVGPKWVIKRYRLHDAAEQLAEDANVDWRELALQLGYFDQAHFIRDFKTIVGSPPAEYARAIE